MKETLSFQTEVKQLLQLMIHSLYSNKEIFLRELISNSADAIDKLRFQALNKPELLASDSDFKITITADQANKTISITDNGIGMSKEEVIDNLGTIAKSGTKAFLENLSGDQKKDANMIGQFGVGFYSAFIVADTVTVETLHAGDAANQGVRWQSKGDGEFSIESIEKKNRGTTITLQVKPDCEDLLSDWTLRRIVNTYSDHIAVPIYMKKAPEYDKDGKVLPSEELEVINQAQALWSRPKNEISDEQYQELYKHISHDFDDALAWTHFKVEGRQEYTSLLYIPSHAPFDLYDQDSKHGVKLYVKRVFIMDDAKKLMPNYLRFIKGLVDSNDLPLNVSREILQENKDLDSIRSGSVKKVLDLIENLSKHEQDKFKLFWSQFGPVFKEGIGEDQANQERIAGLCRFSSTFNSDEEQNVILDDYIARMPTSQDKIYYITADTYEAAKNSPHLEIFQKKNIEVLLLTDRVDEWVVGLLHEYKGKQLASVVKGAINLDGLDAEQEKAQQTKEDEKNHDVIEKFKVALKDKIEEVRTTVRLTESPACLVVGENDMSQHLARMLEAAGTNPNQLPKSKPTLEINPGHKLIKKLAQEDNKKKANELAQLIYDQALLSEGGKLDNPAEFIKRMNRLITAA